MMSIYRLIAAAAMSVGIVPLHAATLVEQRDTESSTIMYIEGVRMRAETPGEPGYMLMNFEDGTMYMVNPKERTVLDNSAMIKAMREQKAKPASGPAPVRFEHKGAGPMIAGYSTEHYAEYAGGVHCGDVFLSREAMDDSGFDDFMDAMESGVLAGDDEQSDPCDWGSAAGFALVREHGYPLRELAADGSLDNEVVRIQTGAALPEGGFELPAGFQVVTMEQMMQGLGGLDEDYADGLEIPEDMRRGEAEEALEDVKSLLESMKDRGN